jgi:hypothetical protein
MITVDQYLNQWRVNYGHIRVDLAHELTDDIRLDAQATVDRANALLAEFGEDRDITSGWRPEAVNKRVPGAALRSKHTLGMAIDISDPDGDLDEWCLEHPDILERIGVWQEHPASTKSWTHLQTVAPKSGKRCFFP